jgi:hypothetical protein
MKKIFFSGIFAVLACLSHAQTGVGNFTLMNVADGKMVSLDGYPECIALAVVFTSNECAFDRSYTDRLRALMEMYQGKIQFLLVNSFTEPGEAIDKMAISHSQRNLPAPYLADKEQTALECLGARKSPEVFLIRNEDRKLSLVYSGAIDDNPQVSKDVRTNYLKDAIDRLLKGEKGPFENQRAAGCTIRKK